tara:strand:+ start:1238 stop:2032 length:795 start_codon:yes stop_codon:yes gene_type:complete
MELPADILRAALASRRELDDLEVKARAALDRQLAGVLERVIADLDTGRVSSLFERGQLRWVQLVLQAMQAQSEPALRRVLLAALRGGVGLGGAHAIEELEAWLALRGVVSTLNIKAAAQIADELVLERVGASLAAWKREGVERMRPHLVGAVLSKRGDRNAADAIAEAFQARRFAAERIVRTELSTAYHRAHLNTLEQARQADLPVQKTCVAVFDGRTAQDSIPVHNQIRELDEEFVDGQGRRYLTPPGRPNDREKMVAYLPPL